jgi:hypothetical protein
MDSRRCACARQSSDRTRNFRSISCAIREPIPAFCDGSFKRRLAADLLAQRLGQPRFTWGSANLVAIADTRRAYVAALQAGDRGAIAPLMAFARS